MTVKPILATAAAALTLGLAAPGVTVAQSGPLMIYTSTPTEAMNDLIARFNDVYPDIEVEFFRSGTTEVMNKLEAEFAAGDPQPDVLLVANSLVMTDLKNDDRLMAYPEAPVDGFDPAVYDADMTYFGTKLITTGIAYNTDLVAEAPTSWTDLTSDDAANSVIMPSPLYSGAAAYHVGTVVQQDGFGWDYYDALMENGAIAGRGNGSVLDAVARGEQAYGIIVDFMPLNAKRDGSPVDFVFPVEGVSAITEPVAILSTADNVEAAKAFVDFQLSEAGQQFAAEQGYIPAKQGVAPPDHFPPVDDLTIMAADPGVIIENDEANKREFADRFGG